jgi:hypothetical protein
MVQRRTLGAVRWAVARARGAVLAPGIGLGSSGSRARRLCGRLATVLAVLALLAAAGVGNPGRSPGAAPRLRLVASGQDLGPVSFSFGPYALPGTAPRPEFSFSLEPGVTVGDAAFLQNRSSFPQTFEISATDVYNEPRGGAFAYRDPGSGSGGPASWVHLDVRGSVVGPSGRVVVPPGTAWRIPFTVTAPLGTAPGTYAAGIVALDVTTIGTPGSKNYLEVHEGIGARVFMTVLGRLTHQVAVGRVWASPRGGGLWPLGGSRRVEVHVQVANTGNSVINELALRTRLEPLIGGSVQLETLRLSTLLPGSTVVLSVPATLEPLEGPAHLSAQVVTEGGLRASGGGSAWAAPWGLGLALVALVLGGLALVHRRRSRRQRRTATRSGPAPATSTR